MTKDASDFYRVLLQKFPYQPTSKQQELYHLLVDFIFSQDTQSLFLLKGYAGTGKTSAPAALVASLWMTGKKAVLLAPMGELLRLFLGIQSDKHLPFTRRFTSLKNRRMGR